jgi:hypothetical protein
MFYYLEDHSSSIILAINSNPYAIKNLKSGILDCNLFSFTKKDATVDKVIQHLSIESNKGIKLSPPDFSYIDLTNYQHIKDKVFLCRIRLKALLHLLQQAEKYRNYNSIGFHPIDYVAISWALDYQERIGEYAEIMDINADFAKQELELFQKTLYIDNFRIFVICEMWKKKINQSFTLEEIDDIIENISNSFQKSGTFNV